MFTRSEELLTHALKIIPNGTQTFSKSRSCLPYGVSPFYTSRAQGSRMWDVDGNEFIDFTSALTAIILGYNDPDVNAAVKRQVDEGVIFSLPHELEIRVSEMICDMVPCAEMVRFGKNGSDATTGAIRLARAYTGRDHIAVCGYHGWHDWYIGVTGRNLGVPQATKDLTHVFQYNDIDSLHRILNNRPNQFACVIMEPMNRDWPKKNPICPNGQSPDNTTFLHEVKSLARQHGVLFILDEVITGFRFALGGAQEYFGVTPDLATFGKAVANGYPLSVLAGKAEIMQKISDVHYSFTYGGELVSLAAAEATLKKLKEKNVPRYLMELGRSLPGTGHLAWRHLKFNDDKEKTFFLQEMFKRGIYCLGTINLNYAHTQADVDKLQQALQEIQKGGKLECEPLKPLFKIR